MDQKLIEALNHVRAKRGMDIVRKTDEARGPLKPEYTTHAVQPKKRFRPSKGRRRSEKDKARSKAWLESKRVEALDLHPSDLQVPTTVFAAASSVPEAEVNPTDILKPVPAPEQKLTREQAAAQGKVIQKSWGVWQYRPKQGAPWVVCLDPNEPAAPAVMTIRRPLASELYAKALPVGLDRRCQHAKLGLPPDGTCTGNCDGKAGF
jgi:hypothetical protein